MTLRIRIALVVAMVAAIGAGLFALRKTKQAASSADVLDALPRDSFLVVTVDVASLRASPLAQPLAGGASGSLLGLAHLSEVCGFDPFARVKQLALAVPEAGENGDFGIAAVGDIARDDFVACAQKIIAGRGGIPKVSARGTFTLIEDGASASDSAAKAAPQIALREGGPLLVGRGAWLQAMIDVAEGRQGGLRDQEGASEAPPRRGQQVGAHLALRSALVATKARAPTVMLTAILPKALRERLKREMGAEASAEGGGNSAMAGVLGVETAGIAMMAGQAGQESDLAAELHCETEDACALVKTLLEKKRLALSQDFGARLIGLGPLIDSLTVAVHDTTLSATTHAPTDQLAAALEKVLKMRAESAKDAAHDARMSSGATRDKLAATGPSGAPLHVDEALGGKSPARDGGH